MYSCRNALVPFIVCLLAVTAIAEECRLVLPVHVQCDVSYPRIPVAVEVDFAAVIESAGVSGVLDPNRISVASTPDRKVVAHVLSEEFTWGDRGTIAWVMTDTTPPPYEIAFSVVAERPPIAPSINTPRIGTGDLLRYNAGMPRPVVVPYLGGLFDLTGDGQRDLVGCWNYAYQPGLPWDGIILYPRTGAPNAFTFGEMTHLRYVTKEEPENFRFLSSIYMHAAFADLNGDALTDLIYSPMRGDTFQIFLNTGRRDGGGLPVFEAGERLQRPGGAWNPCRVADLDRDGALDIVIGTPGKAAQSFWLRNTNPAGWPLQLAAPKQLDVPEYVCFLDIDEDGWQDAVGLRPQPEHGVHAYAIVWQRNLGESSPAFGEARMLESIRAAYPTHLAAVKDGPQRGLLVLQQVYQQVAFYPLEAASKPFFGEGTVAQSLSAVMSLSDQAWPCFCDWDDDGDLDMLIGGGYGWPRIVINQGTTAQPRYAEPQRILSEGEPIRLLRNELLGEPHHGHNMGYSYPIFEDWDADGLRDLLLPNETNRIYWYKNIGSKAAPAFGARQVILVDGYEESAAARKRSAERALEATYPLEAEQPFFWRTGAAVADWNGDGLMDLATHDGKERHLTLFAQYRDANDILRLRRDRKLLLDDDRVIDDRIVKRSAHWTESFKPVDWDGDGLLDIIYACAGTRAADGSIYLLRNVGTHEEARFAAPRTMTCFGEPIKVTNHGPHPWAGDVDGDGLPDLVTCVEWSVYPFYSHAALEMDTPPVYTLSAAKRLD